VHRLASLTLVCLLATVARAGDPAAARAAFAEGSRHYAAGKYAEALPLFQRAYDAYPIPALLYNLAQCYRHLGADETALHLFKRLLADPTARLDREEIAVTIGELEQRVTREARTQESMRAAEIARDAAIERSLRVEAGKRDAERARRLLLGGIGVTVAGVALAGIGGALEGLAVRDRDALDGALAGSPFDASVEDRMRAFHAAAIPLLCVGGAVLIGGVVLSAHGGQRLRRAGR
jgi:tetratricopeptide (TPR) repeat protein